jgi:gamma-glutamyltranspeptidase/glutathione hydrolase
MFYLEDGHPSALAPGRRPRTTLISYLISDRGQPVATVGCPGGDDQGQANLQIILNMLVFGMNPQQAVEAPRFATETLVDSFWPHPYKPGVLSVEPGIPERTRAELQALGHTIEVVGACGIGAVVARRDPATGVLSAGADPRSQALGSAVPVSIWASQTCTVALLIRIMDLRLSAAVQLLGTVSPGPTWRPDRAPLGLGTVCGCG